MFPSQVEQRESERSNDSDGSQSLLPRVPKRTPMACQFCRGRKLKCDGIRPSCSNCECREFYKREKAHDSQHYLVRTGTILLGTLIFVMKVTHYFRPRTLIQTLQLRLLSLEEKLQNNIDTGIMAQSDEIFTAQIERDMGRIRYRIFELQERTLLTSGGILQEIKAVCKGHSLNIMECEWDVEALERDIEINRAMILKNRYYSWR